MSCHGQLPCNEVVRRLWEYIDRELTPEMAGEVQAHLDACAECFPHFDFQRAFVEFLRYHCQTPVPPELRRRVFQQLLEESRARPS